MTDKTRSEGEYINQGVGVIPHWVDLRYPLPPGKGIPKEREEEKRRKV